MVATSLEADRRSVFIRDGAWLTAIGFAALLLPTLYRLATHPATEDSGSQAPIMMATGAWLLYREFENEFPAAPARSWWLTAVLMIAGLLAYVVGHITDLMTIEAGGLYLTGIGVLHSRVGLAGLKKLWFPIVYLAFIIPAPGFVLRDVTVPLKQFVSEASTTLLHATGLPVAHDGVTIYVGQYQLLVENACSGMNSLFGLTAVSLFYIYLRHGPSLRFLGLTLLFAVPIAVGANIVRICLLILMTYFLGDATAEGILHMTTGFVLFGTSLVLIFAIDHFLFGFLARKRAA